MPDAFQIMNQQLKVMMLNAYWSTVQTHFKDSWYKVVLWPRIWQWKTTWKKFLEFYLIRRQQTMRQNLLTKQMPSIQRRKCTCLYTCLHTTAEISISNWTANATCFTFSSSCYIFLVTTQTKQIYFQHMSKECIFLFFRIAKGCCNLVFKSFQVESIIQCLSHYSCCSWRDI